MLVHVLKHLVVDKQKKICQMLSAAKETIKK